MPAIIKMTFNFSGYSQGFSETYYFNAPDSNLTNALATANGLAVKRALLLATGYTLTDIRVGVWQAADGTKPKRQVRLSEVGFNGIPTWPAAAPQYACMCQFYTWDNTQLKKLYMRGIPADLGDLGRVPDQTAVPGWKTNFNSWTSAMIALPTGWIGSTLSLQAIINTYTMDVTTGRVTMTLNQDVTWPLGLNNAQTVWIKLPGKSPLDGNVVVVPTSATSCTTLKPYGIRPFELPGTLSTRVRGLVTLGPAAGTQTPTGSIFAQRIVSHKVGKPSYASRGRAPAKAKW